MVDGCVYVLHLSSPVGHVSKVKALGAVICSLLIARRFLANVGGQCALKDRCNYLHRFIGLYRFCKDGAQSAYFRPVRRTRVVVTKGVTSRLYELFHPQDLAVVREIVVCLQVPSNSCGAGLCTLLSSQRSDGRDALVVIVGQATWDVARFIERDDGAQRLVDVNFRYREVFHRL